MGPMRGHYVSIWQSPKVLVFVFSIIISGDCASYFLEMNMLISLKGTLSQTGMEVGISLPRKGFMRGQYVFLMPIQVQIPKAFIGCVFY